MSTKPVHVQIIAKTNMHKDHFAVEMFEMAGKNGRSVAAEARTIRWNEREDGAIVIEGDINTSDFLIDIRLKSLRLFLSNPAESWELSVCADPKEKDEVGFDNGYLSPVTVRVFDGLNAAVYHLQMLR